MYEYCIKMETGMHLELDTYFGVDEKTLVDEKEYDIG